MGAPSSVASGQKGAVVVRLTMVRPAQRLWSRFGKPVAPAQAASKPVQFDCHHHDNDGFSVRHKPRPLWPRRDSSEGGRTWQVSRSQTTEADDRSAASDEPPKKLIDGHASASPGGTG
jgi:hypothetical protein